jgi:tRNA threonylcarbamoyladenosine biosynthesis protein TsaB
MLLLAVDTSGKQGSIALAQCHTGSPCEILEVFALEGGTFSAQLVPQVASLLDKFGFATSDLGGFVVVTGPGSFTGLRVGLAMIKALAETLGQPIAAVSLLEVVALAGGIHGRVVAALDAGRGEIYRGDYEVSDPREALPDMLAERLCTREEFISDARGVVITPDKFIADLAGEGGLTVQEISRPRADALARIGWMKIQRNLLVFPEDLEANYIRRPGAEPSASRA